MNERNELSKRQYIAILPEGKNILLCEQHKDNYKGETVENPDYMEGVEEVFCEVCMPLRDIRDSRPAKLIKSYEWYMSRVLGTGIVRDLIVAFVASSVAGVIALQHNADYNDVIFIAIIGVFVLLTAVWCRVSTIAQIYPQGRDEAKYGDKTRT